MLLYNIDSSMRNLLPNGINMYDYCLYLWRWDVGNVRNELIRGETGCSTFEEREAKSLAKRILRVVFEENMVSEIGRACLI